MGEVFWLIGEVEIFCRVRYRLEMICCRERPMCRSVPGERYFYGVQSYPPSSVAYAPASPRGEAFCKISFVLHRLHSKVMSGSISIRPHPSPKATDEGES